MKKSLIAILFAFAAVAILGFIGCSKDKENETVDTPTGFKVEQKDTTLVLSWDAVKNANTYVLTKNGDSWKSTDATSLVDYEPVKGDNSYELIASNGKISSKPAKASCVYEAVPQGGNGEGGEDPQPAQDFYIKHPWGYGQDSNWEWRKMTSIGNGKYTIEGQWGGSGANINTSADDNNTSKWYAASEIEGSSSVSIGETVTFTFVSIDGPIGTLSVSGNGGGVQPTQDFYIKHPWGGGDWTWQLMSQNGSSYTYTGLWGGSGANINTSADDNNTRKWYAESEIEGASSVSLGESVTFTFVSTDGPVGTLSVSGNGGGGSQVSKPNTPDNLKASVSNSCIKLTWNASSGATSYVVYRSTSSNGTYSPKATPTGTTYTDCSVSEGTTYYYKISAKNGEGESDLSSPASAMVPTSGGGGTTNTPPGTPSNVKAAVDGSCIKITWNAVSGATAYTIYKSTSSSSGFSNLAYVKTTSYSDCSVTAGTTYYYKVKAWNDYSDGSWSSVVSAKVSSGGGGGGTTTLAAPTNVQASYIQGSHIVQVTWSTPALADSYEIYRSTSSTSKGSKIGTATSAVYQDKLTSSTDKKAFYYYVKAKSSYLNQTSDYSEAAYVYVDKNPVAPCPPSNLKVSGSSSLTITWSEQTQSGCGTATEKWISFYDNSSSSSNKWVSKKVTSNSYSLTSSEVKQYTNNGSTLAGCVKLVNANGQACLQFEYKTDTKTVQATSTNCY